MIKQLAYNKFIKVLLKTLLSTIYNKKYLRGKYFDTKRMGWYWAIRSVPSRIFGDNRNIPWPVHPRTIISNPNNIEFDIDDLNVFQTPGCYWQNHNAVIKIGKGSHIASNVGLITTNHSTYDINKHDGGKDIVLGKACWIGMNSMILPGVELGSHTIVAAGAVVTKSFTEGYCIIGGNPAKIIKNLERDKFVN